MWAKLLDTKRIGGDTTNLKAAVASAQAWLESLKDSDIPVGGDTARAIAAVKALEAWVDSQTATILITTDGKASAVAGAAGAGLLSALLQPDFHFGIPAAGFLSIGFAGSASSTSRPSRWRSPAPP